MHIDFGLAARLGLVDRIIGVAQKVFRLVTFWITHGYADARRDT